MRRGRFATERLILALLADGRPRTVAQVCVELGITHQSARSALRRMAEGGRIVRDTRPLWVGHTGRQFALPAFAGALPAAREDQVSWVDGAVRRVRRADPAVLVNSVFGWAQRCTTQS